MRPPAENELTGQLSPMAIRRLLREKEQIHQAAEKLEKLVVYGDEWTFQCLDEATRRTGRLARLTRVFSVRVRSLAFPGRFDQARALILFPTHPLTNPHSRRCAAARLPSVIPKTASAPPLAP